MDVWSHYTIFDTNTTIILLSDEFVIIKQSGIYIHSAAKDFHTHQSQESCKE